MPPKRKAVGRAGKGGKAAGGTAKGSKKAKMELSAEGSGKLKDAEASLKPEDTKIGGEKVHKVDPQCPLAVGSVQVFDDYDCILRCFNVSQNNDKFYILQLLHSGEFFYFWNRWGRVGEPGCNVIHGPMTREKAIEGFEKKFKDKTRNPWAWRNTSFQPVPGKYTLVDTLEEEQQERDGMVQEGTQCQKESPESDLDLLTQELIRLIHDSDMFKEAMQKLGIDVAKLPLDKLSKAQISKGFKVLDELELELEEDRMTSLKGLSKRFYAVIPFFGNLLTLCINSLERLRQKTDKLLMLGDIEIAQMMAKEKDKQMHAKGDIPRHPLVISYALLRCGLKLLPKIAKEYQVIEKYMTVTKGGWGVKIKGVWCVDRHGEDDRFMQHDAIGNRRLLWHRTHIASVAAILKSGLRLNRHSCDISFVSDFAATASYDGTVGKTGVMLLCEVPLGKQHCTQKNTHNLKSPPKGYNSVHAQGRCQPDPDQYCQLQLGGHQVDVPQGEPVAIPGCKDSQLGTSEFLIYHESQHRIRYLVLVEL